MDFIQWIARSLSFAFFLIYTIELLKTGNQKGILMTAGLVAFYWVLWQFDHSIAPIVWKCKDKIHLDGWLFEDFLNWLGEKYFDNPKMGYEFFEITSAYNAMMVGLILLPAYLACVGWL